MMARRLQHRANFKPTIAKCLVFCSTTNMIHWTIAALMLAHRLRRRANINPALVRRLDHTIFCSPNYICTARSHVILIVICVLVAMATSMRDPGKGGCFFWKLTSSKH